MLAEIIKGLNCVGLDRLERTHPIISLAVWQITSSVFIVASVAAMAFAGGFVIWAIEKLSGAI